MTKEKIQRLIDLSVDYWVQRYRQEGVVHFDAKQELAALQAEFAGWGLQGERMPEAIHGDPFYYHRPGEHGQVSLAQTRRKFRELRDYLKGLPIPERSPADRERSLAITHLQEAMNHAICAVVLADPDAEARED